MSARDDLRARAVATLRRGTPEGLDWMHLGNLPRVRWLGESDPVENVVTRGWIVGSIARKDPEPSSELLGEASLFDPDDAARLALHLLRSWVEYDTVTPELTDRRQAELRELAEKGATLAEKLDRPGKDPEERYRQLIEQHRRQPAPDASVFRGVLAIVAACGDRSAIAEVEAFVERWHEERTESSRSLLRMASWIGGPEARELLGGARRYPALRETAEAALGAPTERR